MLRELKESLKHEKTPNKNKKEKNKLNYYYTISNNALTKNTSRENTFLSSEDLLSNTYKSSNLNSNKYSSAKNNEKGRIIFKDKLLNNNNIINKNLHFNTNSNSLNNTIENESHLIRSTTPYNKYNINDSFRNKIKKSNSKIKNIKKESTKNYFDSIDVNIPLKYNKHYYNTVNTDIQNLEGIINSIKLQNFNKFQDEIELKKDKKNKLENSISILKSKLNMYGNQKKNIKQEDAKNLLLIENMKNINQRYKNINENIEKNKREIPMYKSQIEKLKNETIKINTQIIEYKREINLLKNQIQKLNKMINDKNKEKDNFRPALKLLNNHINNLKQKIKSYDIGKSDLMINLSNLAEKGVDYNK